jgi:hypothetical protein
MLLLLLTVSKNSQGDSLNTDTASSKGKFQTVSLICWFTVESK